MIDVPTGLLIIVFSCLVSAIGTARVLTHLFQQKLVDWREQAEGIANEKSNDLEKRVVVLESFLVQELTASNSVFTESLLRDDNGDPLSELSLNEEEINE